MGIMKDLGIYLDSYFVFFFSQRNIREKTSGGGFFKFLFNFLIYLQPLLLSLFHFDKMKKYGSSVVLITFFFMVGAGIMKGLGIYLDSYFLFFFLKS